MWKLGVAVFVALAIAGTMDYHDEKELEQFNEEYRVVFVDGIPDPVLVPVEQVKDDGKHTDTVRDL